MNRRDPLMFSSNFSTFHSHLSFNTRRIRKHFSCKWMNKVDSSCKSHGKKMQQKLPSQPSRHHCPSIEVASQRCVVLNQPTLTSLKPSELPKVEIPLPSPKLPPRRANHSDPASRALSNCPGSLIPSNLVARRSLTRYMQVCRISRD